MNTAEKKLLILSVGPVPAIPGIKVEGGGLRAWGLAKGIIKHGIKVTIAIPENYEIADTETEDGILVRKWSFGNLRNLMADNDAIYVLYSRGDLMKFVSENIGSEKQLIVDLYVPIYIESLSQKFKKTKDELLQYFHNLKHWNTAFPRGDYFLCANEKQYHYYNGVLSAMGRINPLTYSENLLDIVPYGIHNQTLTHNKKVCKGKIIDKNDFMILWFGGLYPWFDIIPLIEAVKNLSKNHSEVKLVVLGGKNPFVVEENFLDQYDRAVKYSKDNKIKDEQVFFVDWIPYEERNNWYFEADLVVNLHHKTKETTYSWRTRIIDYIWGEIPILTTGGDEASEFLASKNCAILLEENNSQNIGSIINDLISHREKLTAIKVNLKYIKPQFYWDNITRNLADFIKSGHLASDRVLLSQNQLAINNDYPIGKKRRSTLQMARIASTMIQNKGISYFLKKLYSNIFLR